MSNNTENYFFCNRNQQAQELYFRKWLSSVYLPSVKVLRKANLNGAEAQYRHGLEEANDTKEVTKIFLFQRQLKEQEQNLTLIRNNINFIMGGYNAKIHGKCSEKSLGVYTELFNILQCLDLETIEPEIPIASGVIDLTENENIFTKLLTLETKLILSRHSFHNNEFPNQIGAILDEFVSLYSKLRTDFNPALMRPISFPYREMTLRTRCILITTFDLLEGLRRIWSCRPSLTEKDYSENSYVIHVVSEVLDPLFTYSKWPLKEDSSSEARLIHCELGKIPVLGIQVIGERIIVSMLDLFEDVFYQVVEEFLRGSLKLRDIVEEIVRMSVSIKDEINLLPTCGERTSSTSMMSTTYSPPRNS
ncbi:hypothetical protein C2G38_2243170 [Gigaspora rosea]|uniref:Uncharacterized protein n=1 Tax=Gigaspora rosea TaxID=44941 RepID=A0A397VLJ1_9GLOM|nr:hypothetical protein C2G38_2243170 [Gigaspora rosea]